ncbi:hypothetical protein B4589_009830 [Halolamina sp. CBA1230]|uniref:DNA primase family protein n=1 Tax=Halolamina sp. CBA1230 TaxID=1853690 RepID=UPI0009A25969|nr:phage/plasmid primase, P4 family [Halolamina sp. CBA1230]QKY20663.1 hypothetical protein B4589_009830 [Halolamina sp. CBA1230]
MSETPTGDSDTSPTTDEQQSTNAGGSGIVGSEIIDDDVETDPDEVDAEFGGVTDPFTDTEDDDSTDDSGSRGEEDSELVEAIEDIIDSDGPKEAGSIAFRINRRNLDVEDERILEVIESEFKRDDHGRVSERKNGMDRAVEDSGNAGIRSWEDLKSDLSDADPKAARKMVADKMDHEFDFIHVKNEEREMRDFRAYNPNEGVYVWDGEAFANRMMDHHLDGFASTTDMNEVVAKLKLRNEVALGEVNNPDGVKVAVENGVLDVEERTLEPHSPEFLFTRKLNAEWQPDVDTSEVREFIRDITDGESDAKVLEEMFGDTLSPDYKRDWFGLIYGDGANGKSVALNCLEAVLGENNTSNESLQGIAEGRWAAAQLIGGYGMLANIDPDISAKKITDDSMLKSLTGGDSVPAEYKGIDKFAATNTAKMLFAANKAPMFSGDGENLERRLKPLHLPYIYRDEDDMDEADEADPYIKERDYTIEQRLTTDENRAAWLSVMVDSWHRLEEDGWSYEQSQQELWDQYQAEADTIWSFLTECVESSYGTRFDDDTPVHLTVDELHQMCADYHRERGETLEMSAAQFARQINKMGVHEMISFESRKTGQKRSRKWLHPTETGFQHATRDTVQRFVAECDEIDVPAREDDGDSGGEGGSSDPENESLSRVEQLYSEIESWEGEDAVLEATPAKLLAHTDIDWADAAELQGALTVLAERDRVEQGDDDVYRPAGGDGE